MTRRVVVAMSGGVDSSVAAALMQQQGYDVIGVTMQVWQSDDPEVEARQGGCCSLSAVGDARRVASILGIPHYVVNMRDVFRRKVIDYFTSEYAAGRTPNPCVECNRSIKFAALLEKALDMGAPLVATGHYARLHYDAVRQRFVLGRPRDRRKDQSYVLYPLSQEQLAHVVFPLAELEKDETRAIAQHLGLPVFDKPDSQEICFVTDNDYAGFLQMQIPGRFRPGPIVDVDGKVLGQHRGLPHYTVGQRRGLGVSAPEPLYVLDIDEANNTLVVGTAAQGGCTGLSANDTVGVSEAAPSIGTWVPAEAQIRAHQVPKPCRYRLADDERQRLEVVFTEPQRGITPGQAVVLYSGDEVVAGATIDRSPESLLSSHRDG